MEDAELKGAKHVSRVLKTRSRFTALLTVYFFIALIIPNLVLANTEPYSLWTVEALILMPLGFYMMWSVALRRSGVMIWLGFPFIFFCAFQIVLLYLFGNSIIATDMFTNLLTTNPGEAGELLGNIYPAVVLVCVIYLPLLWLAAREIALKRYITYTTRMNIGLTGAVLFSLGILALLPAYRVSDDKHVLRDEIFPLNVLYNLYLSGSEFRKSYNYPETSADFTYGARRTAELPDREVYVYIIGEAARAMNWQLYGYTRETNPRLSEVDGLVVFRDMLTQSNTTHKSVPMILSSVAPGEHEELFRRKGLPALFNEAGFDTWFISNQSRQGAMIDHLAQDARHRRVRTCSCSTRCAARSTARRSAGSSSSSTATDRISATTSAIRGSSRSSSPTTTWRSPRSTARCSSTPTTTRSSIRTTCFRRSSTTCRRSETPPRRCSTAPTTGKT